MSFADAEFTLTIRPGATAEDHELASRLAEWLAVRCERDVISADFSGSVPLGEFPAKFGREWATSSEKGELESIIRFMTGRLEDIRGQAVDPVQGGPIYLPGPLGQFHLGPRLIKTLQESPEEAELWLKLKRCMLAFHDPAIPHATVLNFKGQPGEKAPTIVIWYPDKTEVVSKADYVFLDFKPPATVSWEGFLELASGRLKLVDEDQPLVRACEPGDMPVLIDRARSLDKSHELKAKTAINHKAKWRLTFISKLGIGLGTLMIIAGAVYLRDFGSALIVFGLIFIMASLLGPKKPVKKS